MSIFGLLHGAFERLKESRIGLRIGRASRHRRLNRHRALDETRPTTGRENAPVILGRVVGAHGLRGQIRIRIDGDGPENLFRVGEVWLIEGSGDGAIDAARTLRGVAGDRGNRGIAGWRARIHPGGARGGGLSLRTVCVVTYPVVNMSCR